MQRLGIDPMSEIDISREAVAALAERLELQARVISASWETCDDVNTAALTIRALRAALDVHAPVVRVKPLVWELLGEFAFMATGCFGCKFVIGVRDNGFHVSGESGCGVTLKTLTAAKGFYQRQYSDYVLEALLPTPGTLADVAMRELAAKAARNHQPQHELNEPVAKAIRSNIAR